VAEVNSGVQVLILSDTMLPINLFLTRLPTFQCLPHHEAKKSYRK
jgi:hypothetical protein